MIPSPGRIVEYTLNDGDVYQINAYRANAQAIANREVQEHNTGPIGAHGNYVSAGDTYPMIIVRVWPPVREEALVNGQVLLDGDDTFWATSRGQGDGEGHWREFPRVTAVPSAEQAQNVEEIQRSYIGDE